MTAAPQADRPLGGVAQERARLSLLDQPSQFPAVAIAQVPRPAAAPSDELDDAPAFVGVELVQVLPGQQQELADHDQARGRETAQDTSKSWHSKPG